MQKPVLLPHADAGAPGNARQLAPDQLEAFQKELQAEMLGAKALLEHISGAGNLSLDMAYSVLTMHEARLADLRKRLSPETSEQRAAQAPNASVARLPQLDGVVPNAIRGFLRRCSSGGMSKKQIDIVQANVDEAERLGYFKLAIAEALLKAETNPSQ